MSLQTKVIEKWPKNGPIQIIFNAVLGLKHFSVDWTQKYMAKRYTEKWTDGQTSLDRFSVWFWSGRYNKSWVYVKPFWALRTSAQA